MRLFDDEATRSTTKIRLNSLRTNMVKETLRTEIKCAIHEMKFAFKNQKFVQIAGSHSTSEVFGSNASKLPALSLSFLLLYD